MQRLEDPAWKEQTIETGVLMFSFENPVRSGSGRIEENQSVRRRRAAYRRLGLKSHEVSTSQVISLRSLELKSPTIALEAIDRFARVLALTGMSREQMVYAFHEACARVPEESFNGRPDIRTRVGRCRTHSYIVAIGPEYLNQGWRTIANSDRVGQALP